MKARISLLSVLGLLVLALAFTGLALNTRLPDAGSEEANLTRITARLLESAQFSHHRLDDELAAKFLDHYLDALDGEHLLFLQSDVEEFAGLRPQLAEMTREQGDTHPAHAVFSRYLERLRERTNYVTNLLQTENFTFGGHDEYVLDREHAPRPRSLTEAKELWRQHLRYEVLQEKLADKKPDEITREVVSRYTRFQQTMMKLNHGAVLEIYLNALAHVYDPHSDYLGHEQTESLSMAMNLSLFGVGATLQSDEGYCKIRELIPGGPAARTGLLKPGDRIVAVAQGDQEPVDVVDMPLPEAVDLIRGPKGTTVRLTIIPSGADDSARKTVSLVRDEIKLEDQRAKARVLEMPLSGGGTRRLGVIDLPSFYASMAGTKGGAHESATADVAVLLSKLKAEQVQGIVLDLRRNGGGSLEEAVSLTGLFIPKGPVVQTCGPSGTVDVAADPDRTVAYDGPLVVLTSRLSASASEILAGALQDYGRALIVGDSATFGKGTVQEVLPLAPIFDHNHLPHPTDPGTLKVTIRKFYRPDGASTQLRGVQPDLVLPSLTDVGDFAESAMKDPLPWDAVPPVRHESLDRVRPYLKILRAHSAERSRTDPGLVWLREGEVQMQKNAEEKSVSLNEQERRREKQREQARAELRKSERLAIQKTLPASYEITVRSSVTPGVAPSASGIQPRARELASSGAIFVESESALAENIQLREAENILADYIDLSALTRSSG